MDKATALKKIQDIISDVFGVDGGTVTAATAAKDVDGWDSVEHVFLVSTIEKEFDVQFTDREIAGFNSVGDLLDAVLKKLA